jgi:hypothetical protein
MVAVAEVAVFLLAGGVEILVIVVVVVVFLVFVLRVGMIFFHYA